MIRWIKRLLVIAVLVFALMIGVTFTSENSQLFALILFGFQLPEQPVGLWILIALLLGGLMGIVLSIFPRLLIEQNLANKNRKIRQLEKELGQLRTNHLKA